ncbi:hypothetical protein TNCV_3450471 [Trichonephila clavipes]|uniref:Uncharacterized protein n=1 Tax=Trichonephila clavipes TaxID=2585209 RepID=A0A8X6WL91_TRICX|nr:hypothetical protein TNCV_3450471 [Trichonephila clavipes]
MQHEQEHDPIENGIDPILIVAMMQTAQVYPKCRDKFPYLEFLVLRPKGPGQIKETSPNHYASSTKFHLRWQYS